MTTSDPNVQTQPDGSTIVLEPGDPGYVDPNIANPPTLDPTIPPEGDGPPPPPTSGETLSPDLPVGGAGGEVVAPQDRTIMRDPGESDAEFMARTRNVAVVSESPTDIVPNTPQITMGVQVPVPGYEGELVTSMPPETAEMLPEDEDGGEEETEPEPEVDPEPEPDPPAP